MCVGLLGVAYYAQIHNIAYFIVVQIAVGVFEVRTSFGVQYSSGMQNDTPSWGHQNWEQPNAITVVSQFVFSILVFPLQTFTCMFAGPFSIVLQVIMSHGTVSLICVVPSVSSHG